MTAAALARARAQLRRPGLLPPIVLAGCVCLVHDVRYVLTQDYWNDESWVAVTARYPLSQLPKVTSSTPIGWSLLARVFGLAGLQTGRVLALAFAAGAVAAAYALARGLGWRDDRVGIGAGVLGAIAVLMVPAMLLRDDLKQYTADACLSLTILALTSRLERDWRRRHLAFLAAAAGAGMLVSHTTAFVAAAAFIGVGLVLLARREWRRLLELVVAGIGALIAMGTVYKLFDAQAVIPGLTRYWQRFYIPVHDGPGAGWHYVYMRLAAIGDDIGLGPAWLAVPLVIVGLVTIVRAGRPMTACAIVLLVPEMITVSALRRYPLLELRTSIFLIVIIVVVAAIGVAGLAVLLLRWTRAAAAALGVAAIAAFVAGAFHDVNAHPLIVENLRSQSEYVAAHRAPDDVILVNLNGNWSFGFYWRHGRLSRTPNSAVLQGYVTAFPTQPQIVVAQDRNRAGVRDALTRAWDMAERTPGARIWLVRIHVGPRERDAWNIALRALHLKQHPTGPTGLNVITSS